jgi:hypothetical protein
MTEIPILEVLKNTQTKSKSVECMLSAKLHWYSAPFLSYQEDSVYWLFLEVMGQGHWL